MSFNIRKWHIYTAKFTRLTHVQVTLIHEKLIYGNGNTIFCKYSAIMLPPGMVFRNRISPVSLECITSEMLLLRVFFSSVVKH